MSMKVQTQKANPFKLGYNFILDADSYKLSHPGMLPKNTVGLFAYGESRSKAETIVPFGMQMWVLKTLTTPITREDIDEAEEFAKEHGEPFDRSDWEYILEKYNGFIPVTIRTAPEGLRVPSSNAIYTVECRDPRVAWLAMYIETSLQRGIWYPTTIASNDLKTYRVIRKYLQLSADSDAMLMFMVHDFGGRGVTCEEQAQIGGASHLVFFNGSDTISGIRAANFYYKIKMSAFSVKATEHTIQIAFGETIDGARAYLQSVLDKWAPRDGSLKGTIISIVIDGFNTFREVELLCTEFAQHIKDSGVKVVFRPDSGDPLEIIPRILRIQEMAFGTTLNSKGFKVLNHVGIIQGDGVDLEMIDKVLRTVTHMGFAADNLVFGSGGALLQKVNRDTYKFAQKASAMLVRKYSHLPDEEGQYIDQWVDISKDPITDPGKKSKPGRVTLYRSRMTNQLTTLPQTGQICDEWDDMMVTIYENGKVMNLTTMDRVRELARSEK